MAFEKLENTAKGLRINESIAVGLGCYTGTKQSSVVLRIRSEVMDRLGWKIGDRVECAEGTGSDIDCFQFAKCAVGGHQVSQWDKSGDSNIGSLRINVGRFKYHTFPTTHQTIDEVTFQAFGGQLLIQLPDWVKTVI